MNHDVDESAACAAADLAARLNAELAIASARLELAERRFRDATAEAFAAREPIPFHVLENRKQCRLQIHLLRHVLDGMPDDGGGHAVSA